MRNWIIWTAAQVAEADLRAFVEACGGAWQDDPSLRQGVIEKSNAAVFLSLIDPQTEEYSDEVPRIEEALGATPRTGFDLHISHAPGSVDLAEDVTRRLITRWHAVLDTQR